MSKEKINRIWIMPHVHCSCHCQEDDESTECTDEEHKTFYELFYELPGVSKDNITLRVIKNGIRLEAERDKSTVFFNEYSFVAEAELNKVEASYSNGLLLVTVPLKEEDPFIKAEPMEIKDIEFKK